MKMYWKTHNEETEMNYYIEIQPDNKRILGKEDSGHWKSETGGFVSFEEFMRGDWDEMLTKKHGKEVLQEVREAVERINY